LSAAGSELRHELGGVGGLGAHHERRTIGPRAAAPAPVAVPHGKRGPAAAVPMMVGRPPHKRPPPVRGPVKRPPTFPVGYTGTRLGRLW
jgi:hypothetical protein